MTGESGHPVHPQPTPTQPRDETQHRHATVVVWSFWLALSVAAIFYVAHYAGNMPFLDEFWLVKFFTHDEPVTFEKLWSPWNEHRILLPRLVLIGLARLTGTDFRAGMFFTVTLMSALAAGLIATARGLRGHTTYTDIFFPLALLNWAHSNFLFSFQVQFSLSTFLVGAVLILIVGRGSWAILRDGQIRLGPALLAGVGLVLLPLCGAQGVLMTPPLALWLAYAGIRAVLSKQCRDRRGALVVLLPLLACLVIAAYFLDGYEPVAHHPLSTDLKQVLMTSAEFLWQGFGSAGHMFWAVGAAGLGLLTLFVLGILRGEWRKQPRERLAVAGFVSFLVGMAALALAVGKARSFSEGLAQRYIMLSIPFILALYLAAVRWGHTAGTSLIQGCLFLLAVLFAQGNYTEGRNFGRDIRERHQAVQAAVRSGKSAQETTALCSQYFFPDPKIFQETLECMHKAHVGPYKAR